MLRDLSGLNLIGGDVVEVSPPWDQTGNTAMVGATLGNMAGSAVGGMFSGDGRAVGTMGATGQRFEPETKLLQIDKGETVLNQKEAKTFADAIHKKFPGKILAYNCSPSFNWKKHLSDKEIASFQVKISEMGYKFQFITLAGFHTQNIAIFELAEKYKSQGMTAYSKIQEQEFAREKDGYTSVKHQREVGTSYFDAVSNTISSGKSSTTAMKGSTESEQF